MLFADGSLALFLMPDGMISHSGSDLLSLITKHGASSAFFLKVKGPRQSLEESTDSGCLESLAEARSSDSDQFSLRELSR